VNSENQEVFGERKKGNSVDDEQGEECMQ